MDWQQLGPRVPRRRNPLTQWLGRTAFRVMGWRMIGDWPDEPRLIVAVAPHSSNMDFILSVTVFWALDLKTSYLAKSSLFWFPLGTVIRGLGGLAVDRSSPQGMVQQLASLFQENEQLMIGITPEGTRGKTREWKSGFAQIAAAAAVPVLPAIINYDERVVYLQPSVRGRDANEILSATKQAAAVGSPRNE